MRKRLHYLTDLLASLPARLFSRRSQRTGKRRPRAKRPIRCWFERLEAREVFNATYHGGFYLPHVEAQGVYLGSDWNTVATEVAQKAQLEAYLPYLVQSPYMDLLTDHAYNVGQGTASAGKTLAVTLNKTNAAAGGVSDATIQADLQAAIIAKTIDQPDANKLYVVYVEQGVVIHNGTDTSATTFLGYHSAFAGTDQYNSPIDIHYAVISYPSATASAGFNPTSASQFFTGISEVQTLTLGGTSGGTLTPALNGVSATTAITRTDEVQTLTLGGTASGVLTLSYDGTQAPAALVPNQEVQTLDVGGTDGGIIRLSYNGVIGTEATKLTFTAGSSPSAADVLSHLNSIAALTGNVQVTGAVGGPFTIKFIGALLGANASQIGASVTGGATATAATQTDGSISAADIQAALVTIPALAGNVQVTGPSGGPFKITFGGSLTGVNVVPIVPAASAGTTAVITTPTDGSLPTAAQVQSSLNTITGLTGNVTVTGNAGGPFTITVKNNGNISLLDVSNVTGGLTAMMSPSTEGISGDLDQMTSVTSHEVTESVTDPDVNYKTLGWFDDANGVEVADLTILSQADRIATSTRLNGYLTQNVFAQDHTIVGADATSTPFPIVGGTTALQNVTLQQLTLGRVQVSWTPVAGAVGYRVFLVNGAQTTLLNRVAAPASSMILTGLPPLVTETLRVEAYNAVYKTDPVQMDETLPLPNVAPPQNVKATALTATSVMLTWTADPGAAGYRVFLINGSKKTLVASVGEGVTTATINGLKAGSTVSFRVESFRGSKIADSALVSVTLTTPGLAAPKVTIAAVAGNNSVAQLSWNAVTGAKGYRIYYMKGATRVLLSSLGANALTTKIAGLPAGTSFQVEAFSGSQTSVSSWVHL